MADEKVINGVASDGVDDQTGERFYDLDQRGDNDARVSDLAKKIESLEIEKLQLVHENTETKERIKKLTAEIEELKNDYAWKNEKLGEMENEIERSNEAKKALEVIAARAVELESEVLRLQHDLISAVSEGEEANKEVIELKREVESLKKEKLESEKRVRELERKVGVLEVKEIEEKSKKVRIEEEMRERIDEKEREIGGFRKKVEDLESLIAKKGVELEKWMREKLGLEALVRESEEKAKSVELKFFGLQKEVEEAEKVISGLKEKAVDAINGSVDGIRARVGGENKGLNLDWPVVAAGSTGAIAFAAAVAYVIYVKRR
ncbi:peroxisomal and mitochondrial division factor 2 [Alnus glutinosa]|uniref:peroxisomal and mitochondrial division factor 2 n=1 Tax=Alnus glutinosa TaxID=3517 RepID=UPI002D77D21F|nr:peroxisomal and mitochondrial division factor 2 [Alnus glutinosa]XP_062153194.1 peroxisomal and mitochondrial division factor 2 [Alnus glutinosa]